MKHANMKNTLSFVCLKNINNYKIESLVSNKNGRVKKLIK